MKTQYCVRLIVLVLLVAVGLMGPMNAQAQVVQSNCQWVTVTFTDNTVVKQTWPDQTDGCLVLQFPKGGALFANGWVFDQVYLDGKPLPTESATGELAQQIIPFKLVISDEQVMIFDISTLSSTTIPEIGLRLKFVQFYIDGPENMVTGYQNRALFQVTPSGYDLPIGNVIWDLGAYGHSCDYPRAEEDKCYYPTAFGGKVVYFTQPTDHYVYARLQDYPDIFLEKKVVVEAQQMFILYLPLVLH